MARPVVQFHGSAVTYHDPYYTLYQFWGFLRACKLMHEGYEMTCVLKLGVLSNREHAPLSNFTTGAV